MSLDVKQAIKIAKAYAAEVFADEALAAPTLEEVWFDTANNEWCVTVGLQRKDNSSSSPVGHTFLRREFLSEFKTVRISDNDGEPISIRNYESDAA